VWPKVFSVRNIETGLGGFSAKSRGVFLVGRGGVGRVYLICWGGGGGPGGGLGGWRRGLGVGGWVGGGWVFAGGVGGGGGGFFCGGVWGVGGGGCGGGVSGGGGGLGLCGGWVGWVFYGMALLIFLFSSRTFISVFPGSASDTNPFSGPVFP